MSQDITKEGWVIKCGGKIKTWKKRWLILRRNTLYYYQKRTDSKAKGFIVLQPDMKCRDAPECKRSPFAFCIATKDRDYIIYPKDKSLQEVQEWREAIDQALQPREEPSPSPESPAPTPTQASEPSPAPGPGAGGPGPSPVADPAPQPADGTVAGRLQYSKHIVPFLRSEDANQMCEFWNLWYNTVNVQLSEDANCDIQFTFSYSSDFNKLYWNSAGQQYLMIQQLVDFFYIVGAPEEEIEKLNVVGEKINPERIGSWINVSEKGGIDGGWCFSFPISLRLALEAVETGKVTDQLLAWAEKHKIEQCHYLARDMGAEPPRQTEIKVKLPPESPVGGGSLDIALDAYDLCGFPHPPADALRALRQASNLSLAINITEEEFVRIAVTIEQPTSDIVQEFASPKLKDIEANLGKVQALEFQYLKEDYGYSVYREGYDLHFCFHIH